MNTTTHSRDFIHSLGNAGTATLWSESVLPFLYDTIWLLILPIVIVLVDLWYGISESKLNRVEIRFSGAGWKTLRKIMDYYTLLCLGFIIGTNIPHSYGITIQEACFYSILGPTLFDICSIVGHFLKLRGIQFNIRKFIINIVKYKDNDIGNALDESLE